MKDRFKRKLMDVPLHAGHMSRSSSGLIAMVAGRAALVSEYEIKIDESYGKESKITTVVSTCQGSWRYRQEG